MYHITDVKKFINCPRMYYLSKDSNTSFTQYLRNDNNLIDLLTVYFGIDLCLVGKRGDDTKEFFALEKSYEWFFNIRFMDGLMRIKSPLLHKKDGYYEVYFMCYKTNAKEIDLTSYRITVGVLRANGLMVEKAYLIYLNENYVFDDNLKIKELFIVTDKYKNQELIDVIDSQDFNYRKIIEEMGLNSLEMYEKSKKRICRLNNSCEFYNVCFKEENDLPDDNILTLVSSQYKGEMFNNGIKLLKDADLDKIEGSKIQYAQIMASKNNGLYVDKYALKKWLNSFANKTISFIDFEWDRYLIPIYSKMKPLDVVCFEFALYYLKDGRLEHRTFIGTHDCRKEFVEALIEYLPKDGPILAYNADGAEVLRLNELANIYPEYQEELNGIASRFIDLSYPFLEGLVYDVRMRGNFSVKKILSIVSNKSYKDLEVSDGMEAVYSWRNIDKGLTLEEEKIKKNLENYCSLDAYSLVLIYNWLLKLAVI